MKKTIFVILIFCTNLLYGQEIIRNLQWLNADSEINELTAHNGITLYAETENIQNNGIVNITIMEKGIETDYIVGEYISRVIDDKIFFHWFLDYDKVISDNILYSEGFTVQYYFTIQYGRIISHNSKLLDVLAWIRMQIIEDGIIMINRGYTLIFSDDTEVSGRTDAEGFIRQENLRIFSEVLFYLHDDCDNGEEIEVLLAYSEPEKPIYYRVKEGDSLWKIASYDFIYGNPYFWVLLYRANRHNFINDNNPNLIEPGQTLIIPSLSNEVRNGTR